MAAIKHAAQRVAVLIDTQNLYHTAKHVFGGARVHFGRVVEEAVAGRSLVRALAYVITTESRDEQNFFGALEKMGIEIKTKDLQTFVDGSKKADWDVAIAVDAIRIAERVDVVVIASGDGDFIPLVQHLQHMGVQVEIVSFGNSVSSRLREEADIFTDLAQDTEKYLIQVPTQRTQRQNTFTKRIPHAKVTKQHTAPEVTEEAKQPVEQNKKPDLIPLSDKNYTIARKLR
jgi:uncharacterized LabA/DUF88 family protein